MSIKYEQRKSKVHIYMLLKYNYINKICNPVTNTADGFYFISQSYKKITNKF